MEDWGRLGLILIILNSNQWFFKRIYSILIQSLIFSSCLVLPKTETGSVKNCELETKSWTLEVHEIGLNNECYGCGDFVRGILECGGKSEECIAFVAGVSIGWTVIAGSVVVSGNTIHWLEKQGSCEDSFLNNSVNKLYSSTVELGGIVVNSSNDLIKYFSKTWNGWTSCCWIIYFWWW